MAKLLFIRRAQRPTSVNLDLLVAEYGRRPWLDRLSAWQFAAVVIVGGLVTATAVYAAGDAKHRDYLEGVAHYAWQSAYTVLAPAGTVGEPTYQARSRPKQEFRLAESAVGRCNPNYSGCVPNARDVDCLGGNGNGPAFSGRVMVIGVDVYGLDADGDGVGCE